MIYSTNFKLNSVSLYVYIEPSIGFLVEFRMLFQFVCICGNCC